jgi:phage baseplate assembly protein V
VTDATGEHARLIGNGALIGVVAELDEAKARVRVDVDGLRTDWIPWATHAGPGVRSWSAPEVGSQVVLACPYGDPSQGVVIGGVYRNDYKAPADKKTVHRVEFEDGSVVEYDRESHTLTIDVGDQGFVVVNCKSANVTATDDVNVDCKNANITASTKVTVDTPEAHFTGKITADDDITTSAEVKAGAIGLKSHHHTAQGSTAPTTIAQA